MCTLSFHYPVEKRGRAMLEFMTLMLLASAALGKSCSETSARFCAHFDTCESCAMSEYRDGSMANACGWCVSTSRCLPLVGDSYDDAVPCNVSGCPRAYANLVSPHSANPYARSCESSERGCVRQVLAAVDICAAFNASCDACTAVTVITSTVLLRCTWQADARRCLVGTRNAEAPCDALGTVAFGALPVSHCPSPLPPEPKPQPLPQPQSSTRLEGWGAVMVLVATMAMLLLVAWACIVLGVNCRLSTAMRQRTRRDSRQACLLWEPLGADQLVIKSPLLDEGGARPAFGWRTVVAWLSPSCLAFALLLLVLGLVRSSAGHDSEGFFIAAMVLAVVAFLAVSKDPWANHAERWAHSEYLWVVHKNSRRITCWFRGRRDSLFWPGLQRPLAQCQQGRTHRLNSEAIVAAVCAPESPASTALWLATWHDPSTLLYWQPFAWPSLTAATCRTLEQRLCRFLFDADAPTGALPRALAAHPNTTAVPTPDPAPAPARPVPLSSSHSLAPVPSGADAVEVGFCMPLV